MTIAALPASPCLASPPSAAFSPRQSGPEALLAALMFCIKQIAVGAVHHAGPAGVFTDLIACSAAQVLWCRLGSKVQSHLPTGAPIIYFHY